MISLCKSFEKKERVKDLYLSDLRVKITNRKIARYAVDNETSFQESSQRIKEMVQKNRAQIDSFDLRVQENKF